MARTGQSGRRTVVARRAKVNSGSRPLRSVPGPRLPESVERLQAAGDADRTLRSRCRGLAAGTFHLDDCDPELIAGLHVRLARAPPSESERV